MTHSTLLILVTIVALSFAAPAEVEKQDIAEDRSFSLIPPFEVNPHFGFRKYTELRYEPLTLPFFLPPPIPFGPPPFGPPPFPGGPGFPGGPPPPPPYYQ